MCVLMGWSSGISEPIRIPARTDLCAGCRTPYESFSREMRSRDLGECDSCGDWLCETCSGHACKPRIVNALRSARDTINALCGRIDPRTARDADIEVLGDAEVAALAIGELLERLGK